MKRGIIVFGVVLAVAAAAFATWRLLPPGQTYFTDANTIREPAATAAVRDILWEPPVLLDSLINAGGETYEPRLSNDGSTMLFVRGKAGENADIFLSRRTAQGWSEPQPVAPVDSPADELGPELSADGESLYFYSNRAGGLGGYDLWVSRRGTDGAWREPANLGASVNSQFNDYGPALTVDGRMLYFSSNRPPPGGIEQPDPNAWSATLREEIHTRTYDLYQVELSESGAGHATPIDSLNTIHDEGAPAVTAFGDFLYFASDRPGGAGGFDLYRSWRLRGVHQEPTNLGTAVNSKHHELDPALSMNGFGLDFSSNRPALNVQSGAAGEYKLYHTNSREVFADTEYLERPPIDWAAIWRAVGPNLLWALLALALLLLMLLFFKGAQNRKLSLMAKCVLASLIAHMLLMLLFNVWEVAAALAGEFQRGGPIKVAITGSASHAIASQITGTLTEIDQPEPAITSERVALAAETPRTPQEVTHQPQPLEMPSSAQRLTEMRVEESKPAVEFAASSDVKFSSPVAERNVELNVPTNDPGAPVDEPQLQKTSAIVPPVSRTTLASEALTPTRPDFPEIAPQRSPIQAAQPISTTSTDSIRESSTSPVTTELGLAPRKEPELAVSRVVLAAPMPESQPQTTQESPGTRQFDTAKSMATPRLHLAENIEPSPPTSIAPQPPQSTWSFAPVMLAESLTADEAPDVTSTSAIVDMERLQRPRIDVPQRSGPPVAFAIPESHVKPGKAGETESTVTHLSPRAASLARADILPLPGSTAATQVRNESFELRRSSLDATSSKRAQPFTGEVRDSHASPEISTSPDSVVARLSPPPATALELGLPDEMAPPENPYPQRAAVDRLEHVKRLGGSEQTEQAVELALQWLARHQSSDGRWDADEFDSSCGGCGGHTQIAADHALTGLGLLCFLGAGHTHTQSGPYQDNVQRALNWLVARQKPDGDLRGGKETMYTHGIATIAIAESYAMSGDVSLSDPVHRAVRFVYRARNPEAGGWRYDPGQAGDTSVLGWQVMALKSAARAGVSVPDNAFVHARDWLDRVSRKENPGLYSYQPTDAPTPSMTAEALFAQQLLGLSPSEPRMIQSVEYLLDHLPDWDREAPTYYWYYASLALFQHQGDAWRTWNNVLSGQLIGHQRRDGKAAGSWDPSDEWSRLGGRVYQTALCTLMLEVYYRYLPMYGQDALADGARMTDSPAHEEAIGVIRGRVTDRSSRKPISGAQVRLVLSGRETLSADTDESGRYELAIPATPDHFALSASRDAYVPQTASLKRARLEAKKTLTVNFTLEPENSNALATESAPDVHHLGDDRFSGDINSQFQKRSEGSTFSTSFEIGPEQLKGPLGRAELRLMVKGVQRRHKIYVNNRLLETRLDEAPEDGSFGEFVVPILPELLVAGSNSLRIAALPSDDDVDDFEFVNIRVYLIPPAANDRGARAEPASAATFDETR